MEFNYIFPLIFNGARVRHLAISSCTTCIWSITWCENNLYNKKHKTGLVQWRLSKCFCVVCVQDGKSVLLSYYTMYNNSWFALIIGWFFCTVCNNLVWVIGVCDKSAIVIGDLRWTGERNQCDSSTDCIISSNTNTEKCAIGDTDTTYCSEYFFKLCVSKQVFVIVTQNRVPKKWVTD